MFQIDDHWVFSASDLVAQMGCDHRTALSLARASHLVDFATPKPSGMLSLAAKHGDAHEARLLEALRATGVRVVEVPRPAANKREAIEAARSATVEALTSGADVVYQATFFDGEFFGMADFVRRVGGSAEEGWRYEVWDAKLARSPKPGALLQLAAYSEQLSLLGFPLPERMHVWLGDGTESSHDVSDVLPVLRRVRAQLRERISAPVAVPDPVWADARPACGVCSFSEHCASGREQARDLSLVAGIRGDQRRRLREAGVTTVEQLGALGLDQRPDGMGEAAFERLVTQARLQSLQHADGRVRHEVFATDGLALLPSPSRGDVWFDMEGDPFARGGRGLEYLFGAVTAEGGSPEFSPFWGHDPAGERRAFQQFVDFVEQRRARWPDLHVYHYAPYERVALGRLAGEHGTREREVDDWLRQGVLVDLYTVVRGSVRVSQDSYSIKKLEPLYGFERTEDVTTAGDSVVDYEAYLDHLAVGEGQEAQALLDGIGAYNRADCISTWELDQWLRALPEAQGLAPALPGSSKEVRAASDQQVQDEELVATVLVGVPADARTPEQQARAMLAAALGYHAREDKPLWWEHFARVDSSPEQLDDDPDVLLVERADVWPWEPKRVNATRRLEIVIGAGDEYRVAEGKDVFLVYDHPPEGLDSASTGGRGWTDAVVVECAPDRLVVVETAPKACADALTLPLAVLPNPVVRNGALRERIRAVVQAAAADPGWPASPAHDILARRPPEVRGALPRTGDDIADVTAAVRLLDSSYVAVQGPPGSGKTYLGAHVIAALVGAGWRVGVVAQSHAVVENMLDRVIDAGVVPDRVAKEPKKGAEGGAWSRTNAQINDLLAGDEPGVLIGGTAWTFCRKQVRAGGLDLLVIDEAGQFSLANTIAVAAAARSLLLLGDPAQLPQVSQGAHPEPVNEAALSWLAAGEQVLPDEFGYFLDTSWRMHPAVCAPVSRLAYRGQLHPHERTSQRSLDGMDPGVHWVPVTHTDRSVESPEEVEAVLGIVRSALGRPWRDEDGERAIGEADVLVVSPFNRQVDSIRLALDAIGLAEVRVGTVDKFQGQEAPVVVVSMAASSQDDVPRGLEFLLQRNRLNVAVSRAQWAAHVVHSPALEGFSPTSVQQLVLLGGFLGLGEVG